MKTLTLLAIVATAMSTVSCMTTYDAYGRPVQSVDPGAAVAGVAAAGILGYAIGRDVEDGGGYRRGYPRHYGHHHHRRGYYR